MRESSWMRKKETHWMNSWKRLIFYAAFSILRILLGNVFHGSKEDASANFLSSKVSFKIIIPHGVHPKYLHIFLLIIIFIPTFMPFLSSLFFHLKYLSLKSWFIQYRFRLTLLTIHNFWGIAAKTDSFFYWT